MKGLRNCILNTAEYISNGKNLKIKPINLILKDKSIACSLELTFRIISRSSSVNIIIMYIISSDVEINENYLLGIKSNKLVNALKLLGLPHFLGFLNN